MQSTRRDSTTLNHRMTTPLEAQIAQRNGKQIHHVSHHEISLSKASAFDCNRLQRVQSTQPHPLILTKGIFPDGQGNQRGAIMDHQLSVTLIALERALTHRDAL